MAVWTKSSTWISHALVYHHNSYVELLCNAHQMLCCGGYIEKGKSAKKSENSENDDELLQQY